MPSGSLVTGPAAANRRARDGAAFAVHGGSPPGSGGRTSPGTTRTRRLVRIDRRPSLLVGRGGDGATEQAGTRHAGDAAVAGAALANPRVKAAAPYVLGQAMVSAGEVNRGALIRGIDPAREDSVADIGAHMRAGSLANLRPGEFGIVLGGELARALDVRPGETVVVITPQGNVTAAGTLPRLKSFRVVGVFEVGMYEFDSGLALINIED